jgi:hypothetical protein
MFWAGTFFRSLLFLAASLFCANRLSVCENQSGFSLTTM